MTWKCEWIDVSNFMIMGKLRFCLVFIMLSSTSLIVMCQATLVSDGNHGHTTTDLQIAYFFLNTQCSILPPCSILPRLPYSVDGISKSIFSIIFYTECGPSVFRLPVYFLETVEISARRLIIVIKWEIWIISHCLGLRHETIGYTVCLALLL